MTTLEIILSVVTAFGGLELIKWLFTRKANARVALAEAESAEFHTLQETNEWLQQQMQAKEERFVEQTKRLRQTQDDLFRAREEMYAARLELALKKCEETDCPFRRPPTAQTPPRPGISRESYFNTQSRPDNESKQ